MPVKTLNNLAKKARMSSKKAEDMWQKAKAIVKKGYDYSEDDPRFWALTTTISKRMMKVSEGRITFSKFVSLGYQDDGRE